MNLFDNLPVAACVNGQYLAVHGGISEKLESFDHINNFERKLEPDPDTLVCDLLWSDPLPDNLASKNDFVHNEQRGTACMFGMAPLTKLLQESGYASMIRAHEVKKNGYSFHMQDQYGHPTCITIFSAPNYCGHYGNKGALFVSRPQAVDVLTFEECQEKPIVLQMKGKIDPSTG